MCCECQVQARAMPKDFLLRFSPILMYEKVVDSLINLVASRKQNQRSGPCVDRHAPSRTVQSNNFMLQPLVDNNMCQSSMREAIAVR